MFGALTLACASAGAQPYDGPPSGSTRYWETEAFRDYPFSGPGKAAGVMFWSHGRSGREAQYHIPPPAVILEFAKQGWDVVKVQRNPIFEVTRSSAGEEHVVDLLERIAKARANGYRHIVMAGYGLGAEASLAAARHSDSIFGVVAFAPSPALCRGYGATPSLVAAIENTRSARIVLSAAAGPGCSDIAAPSARIEQALQKSAARYIHFDAAMPIRGERAALTPQFNAWYADCIVAFMATGREPPARRTICPPPANSRFLVPANVKLDAAPGKGSAAADMTGPWFGTIGDPQVAARTDTDICLVVDKVTAEAAVGTAYFGAGPTRANDMSSIPFQARMTGHGYTYQGADYYSMTLAPRDAALGLTIVSRDGREQFTAQMKRGCPS